MGNKSAIEKGLEFERCMRDSFLASGLNHEILNLTHTGSQRPCDSVVIGTKILYLELKSTTRTRLPLMPTVKSHQIKSLQRLNKKRNNTKSLILIEFNTLGYLVYMSPNEFLRRLKERNVIDANDETLKKIPIINGIYDTKKLLEV